MSIFLKFIFRNLYERKLRTIVMILSIVLSTALLFASLAVGESYMNCHEKLLRGMAGKATVSVMPQLREDGKVSYVKEDIIVDSAGIKNKVGIMQTYGLFTKENNFESFDLIAADLEKLGKINKMRLLKEKNFEKFAGDEIVIPQNFSKKYNISLGDNVTFKIMDNNKTFTVVAIAANDNIFLRKEAGYTAILPKETLEKILNVKDEYNKILIETAEETNIDTFIFKLTNEVSANYKVSKTIDQQELKASKKSKSMPFLLISFFSLVMSIFIIFSSYKVITIERMPNIGTFRSVGATEKKVKKILIMESLIYGILGGIVGIPIGFGILKVMLKKLAMLAPEGLELTIAASTINIVLSATVAIIVSLLSAYIPIKRASKLPIKDVVLGTVEQKNISNKLKLAFGVICFIVSIVMPYTISDKNSNFSNVVGGLSMVGLIISTMILIPLLIYGTSVILEKLYEVIFGNEGKIAARNLKWNRNINHNIMLLVISISSVIVIMVIGSALKSYMSGMFKDAKIDGITSSQNIDDEFVKRIKNVNNVKQVLPIYVLDSVSIEGKNQEINIDAVQDINLYNEMFAMRYDNDIKKNEIISNFNNGRNILINDEIMKKINANNGDIIKLKTKDGFKDYTIISEYKCRANLSSAVIPSKYIKEDFKINGYSTVAYSVSDIESTSDIENATKEIRNLYNGKVNETKSIKSCLELIENIVNSLFMLLDGLTYFILILGIVGIINNLIINYIEKKRYIAMYKSVGLSKMQHIKMVIIEGFTVGLIGGILGTFIAYLESKIIFKVAGPRLTLIETNITLNTFIIAVIMGIVITLIGSVIPIIKSSKLQIVEEVRFE